MSSPPIGSNESRQRFDAGLFNQVESGPDIPQGLLVERAQWDNPEHPHPYAHYLRRAWDDPELGIYAAYCVNGRPTIYFKTVAHYDPVAETRAQRALWNQGMATLLVVSDPATVRIYSSFVHVSDEVPSATAHAKRRRTHTLTDACVLERLDSYSFALELENWLRQVETGQFYRDHYQYFRTEETVDKQLLKNLRGASDALCTGSDALERRTAHAIIGRLLFVCYLCDRKILAEKFFENQNFPGIRKPLDILMGARSWKIARNELYRLFLTLQSEFNGSLLNEDLVAEREIIAGRHMEVLTALLRGDDVWSGQQSLFPYYNFKWIPIETISAIYEGFLASEDESEDDDVQAQNGAFYTPRHLAEMTVDIATRGWTTLLDKRCLDPACGSGIFLVILFNRMAEEWHARNKSADSLERASALRKLLTENLCGVDLQPTACRITCFSLYLALLDRMEPRDIWEFKQRLQEQEQWVLPLLLQIPEHRADLTASEVETLAPVPEAAKPVIFQANFFACTAQLFGPGPLGTFDLVLGNPPWTGRNQKVDPELERWVSSEFNPFNIGVKAKDRLGLFYPQRNVAITFIWKAPLHLNQGGRACLVLPSKVLLSKTDKFQAAWLRLFTVERVVQLADFRHFLFENAHHPATIVAFNSTPPVSGRQVIPLDVPKAERKDPRHAVIHVHPDDQTWVTVGDVIQAAESRNAAQFWKERLWGRSRDWQLLERLRQWPALSSIAGSEEEGKRWIKAQGAQPFDESKYKRDPKKYGESKAPKWASNALYVDARTSMVNLVLTPQDCRALPVQMQRLRRSASAAIFNPPMVLANQVFSRVAFCDFPVAFQDWLASFSGDEEDRDLLRFFAGVLNSPLPHYYLFHTSSNWGVERDQVHLEELMRFPFPLPGETRDPERARGIVAEVSNLIQGVYDSVMAVADEFLVPANFRSVQVRFAKERITNLVYEYYGITPDERILIEDTVNVFIKSATPASSWGVIPSVDAPRPSQCQEYASLLCGILNGWIKDSIWRLEARVLRAPREELGLVVIQKIPFNSPEEVGEGPIDASVEVAAVLGRIKRLLTAQGAQISYMRGLTAIEEDAIFLLKPLQNRFWIKSAAIHDADDLIGAFLTEQSFMPEHAL